MKRKIDNIGLMIELVPNPCEECGFGDDTSNYALAFYGTGKREINEAKTKYLKLLINNKNECNNCGCIRTDLL